MCTEFTNPIHDVGTALNLFSQSTGDVYIFYDFREGLVHFSENIQTFHSIFSVCKTTCTIEEWRVGVDSHDIHRLANVMADLTSRKTDSYNFNYRVTNTEGRRSWINSRGRAYYGDKGQLCCVLGRLAVCSSVDFGSTSHNKALKMEIKQLLSRMCPGFLLLVGVDNLKAVNLKNGRDFGDAVLHDVAQVMDDETAPQNLVYRINGDWFAVNMPEASEKEVSDTFARIQERLSGQCTVSGGCVSYTAYHVSDADMLLQYAEISLDQSKVRGKNTLTFFSPENYEQKLRELEIREDLRKSIEMDFEGFELYYQPQFYSETSEIYGAEALLRYSSPRLGNIPPTEIIPILEQSRLIYPVGLWVIKEALKSCRKWREIYPQFHVSVNMSYYQLEFDSIEEDVLELVRGSGVPGSALTIEVTESTELSNYPQLNEFFKKWKKDGIEISVDDFGTGYSSLGRLKEMAVDEIKIDRCFVREIQNSAYNYRLLSNIIELADSSQIRVCCEGVETQEELEILCDLRPALLQGYLFAKPCSEADFEARFIQSSPLKIKKRHPKRRPRSLSKFPYSDCNSTDEIAQTILNAENDIFYLADLDTYELYYLNSAGQKMFGVKDYCGKKCYKVLHGNDKPCSFCTNSFLHQDSFYIWEKVNEYCGRHFLLKDKIVQYKGKNVRLEVALDITKQEYVSQSAKERLIFADKIVGYMNTLSVYADYKEAVRQVLASVGDFYQADRAYLFERNPQRPDHWDNTYEWCAVNVAPQQNNLQNVPPKALSRWMKLFEKGQSIILLNLDPLRESSPAEWKLLHAQGIQRLIVVPIRENHKTIGFVGVDNPRYCIHDDSQVRVLNSFLLARLRQDRNEQRYQILLQESNQELLGALNVGFWTLKINKKGHLPQMVFDNIMCQLLNASGSASPEECYEFWSTRIRKDVAPMLERAFEKMKLNNQLVQIEYPWEHVTDGEITLRFSGILIEDTDDHTKYKGYCRKILPHKEKRIIRASHLLPHMLQ